LRRTAPVRLRFPLTLGDQLPGASVLDRLSYSVIAFAFPVWTFAIIAGGIWAESAWGRYWGWDPKETWSFITWVLYAGYLHARATAGWKGRKAAWVAVAAAMALIVDYYVVNIFVVVLRGGATGALVLREAPGVALVLHATRPGRSLRPHGYQPRDAADEREDQEQQQTQQLRQVADLGVRRRDDVEHAVDEQLEL